MRVFRHSVVLLLLAFCGAAVTADAQTAPLRVNVLRALEFGRVIGGMETRVEPDGSSVTAQFEILGPPGASVQLLFTLPSELNGDGGARLPVSFNSSSAAFSTSRSWRDAIVFDPRAPFTITLPSSGRIGVMIGGQARPGRQLRSGPYQGNLTLVARIP